ncbi:MAG: hypothetical protein IKS71_04925, partial [Bacteroidales bacterium]|nr:hypothetical protein [Bacteroidales bacterium]
MAHESDYSRIWAQSDNGLKIEEIRKALGATTRDEAALCTHANIKKWQKYKPVRSSQRGGPTQEEALAIMKAANYGFGGSDMFLSVDPTSIFNMAVANGCDWPYLKPRGEGGGTNGADEWYRQLDFNGYKKDAILPPLSIDAGFLEADGQNPDRVYLTFQVNSGAELKLLDFSFADLNRWDSINDENYKYAVMIRKRSSTGTPTIYYGINVFKYENGVISYNHGGSGAGLGPNDIIYFQAPSDATPQDPYQIIPCIIKKDLEHSQLGTGPYIYLPAQIFYFNGSSSTGPRADQFQITAMRKTHSPTASEAAAGTGYFDVEFDVSFRALRAARYQEFGETQYYFGFYGRLRSAGGNWGPYSAMLGGRIFVPAGYYMQT